MNTKSKRVQRYLTTDDCDVMISAFGFTNIHHQPDSLGWSIVEILRTPRLREALAALTLDEGACEALADGLEAKFLSAGLS